MKTHSLESRITRRPPLARRITGIKRRRQRQKTSNVALLAAAFDSRVFDEQTHGLKGIDDSFSRLRRLETDPHSIIVAVDGSCANNGLASARAGYGVFFGTAFDHLNSKGVVPDTSPQTSQYAELYATMQALETLHQLIITGENVSHVIIKTDSAYLAQGLCQYIWKWTSNGFINSKGFAVTNGKAFRYLHEKVGLLEKDYGIAVSFCKVGRKFNQQADKLAKSAVALDWMS